MGIWRILRGGGEECWLREMVQPSQQHVAPSVKVVEWGFGTIGLRMVAAFWAGIPVEATQDAGVVPRL